MAMSLRIAYDISERAIMLLGREEKKKKCLPGKRRKYETLEKMRPNG